MRLVIDIPEKEFGIDIEDKFQDFFKRLEVEIKAHMVNGTNIVCGAYELETIKMFMQSLSNSTPGMTLIEYLESINPLNNEGSDG